jgi:hypothetical protein
MAASAPAANHREITVTVAASAARNTTISTSQTIAAQFIDCFLLSMNVHFFDWVVII